MAINICVFCIYIYIYFF